ncbi:hypothetical protein PGT21_006923 [Puccinia graminis f. sp. tritici]|uniref:Subtelomeric hrmA-associated cluster protein AFUB-079030/YDR124W-like helical bundle domain-containing protein n=1 Tax=Puccinia graminis f. sp. tritici TaxID=56615 RepID=A0A5B0QMK5_PUCGR|nr:hypothetical protein PGT21_006923 [Puccinia graminis f. sp. tritici]
MPRIPTRTTPYDTPTRQHRHFKNKRDQVLRALGRSSYINGSQFAIMWVSARGETETYASPVLQGLLESEPGQPALFSPEILQRAKEAALKAPPELKVSEICLEHIRKPLPRAEAPPAVSPVQSDSRSALSGKGGVASSSPNQDDPGPPGTAEVEASAIERPPSEEGLVAASSTSDCSMDEPSPFLNGDSALSLHRYEQSGPRLSPKYLSGPPVNLSISPTSPVCSGSREEGTEFLTQDDPKGFEKNYRISGTVTDPISLDSRKIEENKPNCMFQNDILPMESQSAMPEISRPPEALNEEAILSQSRVQEFDHTIKHIEFQPTRDNASNDSPTIISFSSPLSIASFLENKFRQLQQNTCKLVCKAWIKVIEPKKQRKFPYRSGETSKPDWWPRGVVHREPDHLLKPDRIKLMLAVLGAGKVPVGRLELASAEMAAFIPPDKMDVLKDIYTVAKEEERLRSTWPVGVNFVPFQVELSNNSSEVPSKSSGSPQTMNSDVLSASPRMVHHLPNVLNPGEAAVNFLGAVSSDVHPHEEWPTSVLPGYLNSIEHPTSFTQGKPSGFLPGDYNAYVNNMITDCHKPWAMNPGIFQESMTASNQAKRTGRPGQNILENIESLNQGTPATGGYNFPHNLQTSFTHELLSSNMEGGSSKESTSNSATHDQPFFQEFSTPENTAWGNCGMFFDNGVNNECTQNLWRNVTIPSNSFESSKVLSEESYLV